jgi:protein SCO1/2
MSDSSRSTLRIVQIALWVLVASAAAYLIVPRFVPAPPTGLVAAPATRLGPGVPMTAPFTLINDEGATVTEKSFAGKPGAWFYGFTNCPDICPTALAEMAALLQGLGTDADHINAVFVTVDPERDTQAVMKEYTEAFDARITGLTGELAAITQMASARFVPFEKIPLGDTYAMQHPAGFYLTDVHGNFAGTLDPEESLEVKLGKLKRLVAEAKALPS